MLGILGRPLAVCVVLSACLFGLARVQAQAVSKTELEGTWDGEMSIGGGRTRTFAAGDMWVTFKGNTVTGKAFLGPEGVENRVEIDAKTKPKHLDFIQTEGNPLRGIYDIVDDKLTIAISLTGTRPNGFAETDQTFRVSILKLKRRK